MRGMTRHLSHKASAIPRSAQIHHQGYLQQENNGDTVPEFPVLGLVVPHTHAQPGTYAAAEDGQHEQSGLGDAPPRPACLQLVNAIDDKGHGIDREEVIQEETGRKARLNCQYRKGCEGHVGGTMGS